MSYLAISLRSFVIEATLRSRFPCNPNDVSLTIAGEGCEGVRSWRTAARTVVSSITGGAWSCPTRISGATRQERLGEWFSGPVNAPFDVAAFAASHGKAMTCGKYYRVKLAIKTDCQPWLETVKLVYVVCPPMISAGPEGARG
jgi:hypothetical protein